MANVEPRLKGKRVALLCATGTHDHEFWVPYYRFIEEGAELVVAGPQKGVVYIGEGRGGSNGLDMAPTDVSIDELDADTLDALIIPGGLTGPLTLRAHQPTLKLVIAMDQRRKIIGAICHAPWVLISAGILKGRKATSPSDMAIDITNAGGEWVNEETVRDGHIITSIYFGYLPSFLSALIDAIEDV